MFIEGIMAIIWLRTYTKAHLQTLAFRCVQEDGSESGMMKTVNLRIGSILFLETIQAIKGYALLVLKEQPKD